MGLIITLVVVLIVFCFIYLSRTKDKELEQFHHGKTKDENLNNPPISSSDDDDDTVEVSRETYKELTENWDKIIHESSLKGVNLNLPSVTLSDDGETVVIQRKDAKRLADIINSAKNNAKKNAKKNAEKDQQQIKLRSYDDTIVDQFHLGISKDLVLEMDDNLKKVTENQFEMSRSFSKAWAEELGIQVSLDIKCLFRRDKLWTIHIDGYHADQRTFNHDFKIFINYFNEKYGMNKDAETEKNQFEKSDLLDVACSSIEGTSIDHVEAFNRMSVLKEDDGPTEYTFFIDMESQVKSLAFESHDINWQSITCGSSIGNILEIDDFADYKPSNDEIAFSDNYISSASKAGFINLKDAQGGMSDGKLDSIRWSSNYNTCTLDEVLNEISIFRQYLEDTEKIYLDVVEENDASNPSAWKESKLVYLKWNILKKADLSHESGEIQISKERNGTYCYSIYWQKTAMKQRQNNQLDAQMVNQGNKEMPQKKITILGPVDVDQFQLGATKEVVLGRDSDSDSSSGNEFQMSESFSMAWAKKLGINLPLQIDCLFRKDKLWTVNLTCSTTVRKTLFLELMKFVDFFNEKYGINKDADTDITQLNKSNRLSVGIWSSPEGVTEDRREAIYKVTVDKKKIDRKTNYKITVNMVSQVKSLPFVSHDIDWESINRGLTASEVLEIDDFADYHPAYNEFELSANYISSVSKTVGLKCLTGGEARIYDGKLDKIRWISRTGTHGEIVNETLSFRKYLEDMDKTSLVFVEENDVFESSEWNESFGSVVFYKWNLLKKDSLSIESGQVRINKFCETYHYWIEFGV